MTERVLVEYCPECDRQVIPGAAPAEGFLASCGRRLARVSDCGKGACPTPAATATKETNPKDAVGIRKAPLSTIPAQVLGEVGLAMLEGARKYGRSNYRVAGVRASVYYDAALRHLIDWWEGVDVDPDSGLSHVTKAIAALCVLRDAQMNRMCEDDRPPSVADPDWMAAMSRKAGEIIDRYPNPKAPFVREAEKPTVVLYVKPHEGAA